MNTYKKYLILFVYCGCFDSVIYISDTMKKAVQSFNKDFKRKPKILGISVLEEDMNEEDFEIIKRVRNGEKAEDIIDFNQPTRFGEITLSEVFFVGKQLKIDGQCSHYKEKLLWKKCTLLPPKSGYYTIKSKNGQYMFNIPYSTKYKMFFVEDDFTEKQVYDIKNNYLYKEFVNSDYEWRE